MVALRGRLAGLELHNWVWYADSSRTAVTNGAVEPFAGFVSDQGNAIINEGVAWDAANLGVTTLPHIGVFVGTLTCSDDGTASLSFPYIVQASFAGVDWPDHSGHTMTTCDKPFDVVSLLEAAV